MMQKWHTRPVPEAACIDQQRGRRPQLQQSTRQLEQGRPRSPRRPRCRSSATTSGSQLPNQAVLRATPSRSCRRDHSASPVFSCASQGHRPVNSNSSAKLRKVRTTTRIASSATDVSVRSIATVSRMSAAIRNSYVRSKVRPRPLRNA